MARSVLQTQIAGQAVSFAESFRRVFQGIELGMLGYRPDITEPEGPSTGGGAQARQNIRLLPKDASNPVIVVGFANHFTGDAEIRSFEYIESVHRERARTKPPFDYANYADFADKLKTFLEQMGLTVRIAPVPEKSIAPPPPPSSMPPPRQGGMVVLVVLGGILVTAGCLLWLLLSVKK